MTEILRENVEEKFKWDLSPLCGDDEDFYSKVERANKYLPELKKYEGKLNNKNNIYDFLMLEKEVDELLEPAQQYCFLKNTECLSNEKYNEMQEKLYMMLSEFSMETSFATSEFYEL